MTDKLPLTHATERDIDLLLVEELKTSPTFLAWFVSHSGKALGPIQSTSVYHSVRRIHNRREIDIHLVLRTVKETLHLLVENKLDADEQPLQSESYKSEAKTLRSENQMALTALVCPSKYADRHATFKKNFDFSVSYEEIRDFFTSRAQRENGELAARQAYRSGLMQQAIEKQRRGYVQVVHPAKREFTKKYIKLLKSLAPELIPGPSMLRESAAESVTMIFAPDSLPKWSFLPQMRIVHQLREGNANVNFYRWGNHYTDVVKNISTDLAGTGFRAIPTVNKRKGGNSGLMIVADTPKIDQFDEFESQLSEIQRGIATTRALRQWLFDNQNQIKQWSKQIVLLES